jgi:hypothetical protein
MPIDPRMVRWDEESAAPKIPSGMVKWDEEKPKQSEDLRSGMAYDAFNNYKPANTIGGGVRGAASIGSTLLRPFESAQDNAARRKSVDEGLTATMGSDPDSLAYKTSKFLAELAGTSGVGGLIGKGIAAIPGAAKALPTLLPAIQSGGMSANGATGAYGMANRVAGGAITGGATAGLVDPQYAKEGAAAGAILPAAIQGSYRGMNAVGSALNGKAINPTLQQTARESVNAGYVIPPNMVKPNLGSQILESVSGKQATQQIASIRNTEVTEKLTRQALGIADDVPLTKSTLEGLRKTAGKAYAEVSSLSPMAAADLEALKIARNDAQAWFKAYNRSASPVDLAKAKEFRATSQQLEQALEQHAAAANRPELIPALRDARKEIAKTYTVERALNDAAGTVDARVLGRMYDKGVPLSDGLDAAGKFALAFPSIAKSPQQVGSPAAHNLKAGLSLMMGGGGAGTGAALGLGALGTGGLGIAAGAVPFLAPPLARSIMFSGPAQRSFTAPANAGGLLSQSADEVLPLLYRSSGLLATSP